MSKPDVGDHPTHWAFVAAMFAWYRKAWPKRSYRWAARKVDMTPGHLNNVAKGSRNLPEDKVDAVGELFELNAEELELFRLLVARDRTDNIDAAASLSAVIAGKRGIRHAAGSAAGVGALLQHWYILAVVELLRLPGAQRDPVWVSGQLVPAITPEQAAYAMSVIEAVEAAQASGLQGQMSTGFTSDGPAGKAFHAQLIDLSAVALQGERGDGCRFDAVTAAISEASKVRLVELTKQYVAAAFDICAQDADALEHVVQLNVHLFELTRSKPPT